MYHDARIHLQRLAALVAHLVLQLINKKRIRTITEAGTLDREKIIRTMGGQNTDVSLVEWLAMCSKTVVTQFRDST